MKPAPIESVAIIGMACRFPGAPSLTDFWTLLCQGRDGIGLVPKQRWDAAAMFNEDPKAPGKINTRFGGFIDDVDRFDAAFFSISPREATQMDPQQRILLELAYEAIEDAGLPPAALAGTDTAVYVGAMTNDYMRHQLADSYRCIDVHTGSGAGLCMLANRLSYQFDLRGPSATVDSACSSSLVAVFNACQSLWTGQSRLALAAGVNVMLDPAFNVFYAKAGLSAPDGRCKTFSAAADGIGRAEGAGIVVLKPLQDALADKDPIYAVIRGGAVNHDGRSNGLTQPNRWAQEHLLRRAFAHSGIDKGELGYIELHGTGTLIGDPIEANALAAVLTEGRKPNSSCLVGSVKTNIGHLEAAAGIAGLIKLALSISHAELPPSLWFDASNPHIAFERMPIRVNTARLPWSARNGRRLGGISSFGLGGTNAHLVLESASTVHVESNRPPATADHWLLLSARSETALTALAARYVEFLRITPESDLPTVCGTALRRKGIHDFRLSVIGCNKASLIEGLQAFSAGVDHPKIVCGRFRPSHRRILLAVPEHCRIDTQRLSHWVATAPIARETWNACRAMFRDYSNVTLPSADALSAYPEVVASDPDFRAWHFAGQYALLSQVIGSLGKVETIVADGLGQLAALCVAGALSPSAAIRWLGAGLSREFPERQAMSQPNYSVACDCSSGRNPSLTAVDWSAPNRSWHERLCDSVERAHSDIVVLDLGDVYQSDQPLASGVVGLMTLGDEPDGCQRLFAQLLLRHEIQLSACADNNGFIRLPSYPWQRESYWLPRGGIGEEADPTRRAASPAPSDPCSSVEVERAASVIHEVLGAPDPEVPLDGSEGPGIDHVPHPEHALLGQRADSPTPSWESRLTANRLPYLPDHRVQGLMVLPGSAYAELGLAIHHEISGQAQGVLEHMEFHKALVIEEQDEPLLRVTYDKETRDYAVYSQRSKGKTWRLHASGKLSLIPLAQRGQVSLDEIQRRCTDFIDGDTHYRNMRERGFQYGPYFQGVRRLWLDSRGEEVLAWIAGYDRLTDNDHRNRLHPTILDACLQALLTPLGAKGDTELYIPIGIRQLKLHSVPKTRLWCYGKLKQSPQGVVEGDVVLFDEEGNVVAEARGVLAKALTKKDKDDLKQIDQWLYEFAWEKTATETVPRRGGSWVVFMDRGGNGERLVERLTAAGADEVIQVLPAETFQERNATTFLVTPDSKADLRRVLNKARDVGIEGIVYLWGLDTPNDDGGLVGTSSMVVPAVHLIQALTQEYAANPPRLVVVTRGAQSIGRNNLVETVTQAPLIGLVRVAVNEYPDVRLRAIDIDHDIDTLSSLADEIMSDSPEDELALRGAQRYAHRMVRKGVLDLAGDSPQRSNSAVSTGTSPGDTANVPGSIGSHYQPRREPGPGEVEVALQLATLGRDAVLPNASAEFAQVREGFGVVTRVGKELPQLQPGDDVLVYLDGTLGPHVTVPGASVFPLPKRAARIITNNAAYLPAFISAYYALRHVAHLQPGEKLFLQEVTSPVGLAAIQVARWLGASVYATVAGAEQHDYLQSLGVDYIFDGRSLDFVDRIMDSTEGRGLDVVLNMLSGEFASKAFAVLAPFGRFVDLSNREDVHLAIAASRQSNRSVTVVDAHQLAAEQQQLFGQVLTEVCERFGANDFAAIPVRVFPAAEGAAAIEALNAPERIGTVAISFGHDPNALLAPTDLIRANGTYLISGGFGGFGLQIAAWMVERGARNLVLVGRRGANTAQAQQAVDKLRQSGARVLPMAADVSKESVVKRLIAEVAKDMPPLRGVFHTAAILDDGPLNHVDRKQIENVMKPKALGAWYLHRHTSDAQLDYFVLFSSIASMVGGPGQASYAMACAYLDSLAHYRRGRNLPATSIHWGALGQVGMAARYADVEKYLSGSGVGSFTPAQAVELFGRILRWNPVELGVAIMDWNSWGRIYPTWAASPKYGALIVNEEGTGAESGDPTRLRALFTLDPEARQAAVADVLTELLAQTLGATPDEIDRGLSLLSMGIDSLMAMDLQEAVEKRLAVTISMLELMKGNSVTQLAQHVALTIGVPRAVTHVRETGKPTRDQLHQRALRDELALGDAEQLMAQLNDLTDHEVGRLFDTLVPKEESEQ